MKDLKGYLIATEFMWTTIRVNKTFDTNKHAVKAQRNKDKRRTNKKNVNKFWEIRYSNLVFWSLKCRYFFSVNFMGKLLKTA